MTVKQLTQAIARMERDLAQYTKDGKETLEQRGVNLYLTEIAYCASRLEALRGMLPAAEQAEQAKQAKRDARDARSAAASELVYMRRGNDLSGITPQGRPWVAEHNWDGTTQRTLKCYALYIAGECIFTSGVLDTVLSAVAQH